MWGKTWLSKLEAHDPAPIERALDDVARSHGATEHAERDDRDWRTQMDLLSMRLSD